MSLVKGVSKDDLVAVLDFGGSSRVTSSSTATTSYDKPNSTSALGDALLAEYKKANKGSTASYLEATFGKGVVDSSVAYVADLLKSVDIPLEVDCDPNMTTEERVISSIGVAASSSLTTCSVFDIVKNISAAKNVLTGSVIIGGVSYLTKGKDLNTAIGLSKMYDKLPSVNSKYLNSIIGYFDLDAEAALATRLVNESLRIGLPDVLRLVISTVRNESVKKRVYLGQLRQACMQSRLENVQLTIDYCGVTQCLAKVPDIVYLILKHYKYRGNGEGYPAELTKVKDLLTTLDPTWSTNEQDTITYQDYSPFASASASAKDLFLLDDELYVHVLIGSEYGNRSVKSTVSTMYPYLNLV